MPCVGCVPLRVVPGGMPGLSRWYARSMLGNTSCPREAPRAGLRISRMHPRGGRDGGEIRRIRAPRGPRGAASGICQAPGAWNPSLQSMGLQRLRLRWGSRGGNVTGRVSGRSPEFFRCTRLAWIRATIVIDNDVLMRPRLSRAREKAFSNWPVRQFAAIAGRFDTPEIGKALCDAIKAIRTSRRAEGHVSSRSMLSMTPWATCPLTVNGDARRP